MASRRRTSWRSRPFVISLVYGSVREQANLHSRLQKAMERISGLLSHPSMASLRIISLWEEYEARETPEAKFVKDLDLFELAVQGVEYEECEQGLSAASRVGKEGRGADRGRVASERTQNNSGLLRVDRATYPPPYS